MPKAHDAARVLVTVTGPDTSGITAALTGIIEDNGASLLDIEQVVVQGQLTLCLLIQVEGARARGEPVLKDLLFEAKDMGLHLDFEVLTARESERPPRDGRCRYAVTAIADNLGAGGVHRIAEVLARHGANIDHIRRLSREILSSVEFVVCLPDEDGKADALRADLLDIATDTDIDIALQRENLQRRSKRLVVMDMDSTLIQVEILDEMARLYGVVEEVAEITRRAMAGELDFEQSLKERIRLLEGMPYDEVLRLAEDLPVTEGAEQLLKVLRGLGYKTGVLSGGFRFAADALKQRLGLDYAYANQLEVKGGRLTGRVKEPIVGPQRKADLLDAIAQREGISLEQTIAIGDGANDLAMLERAGLGIAFHAKPKLKAAADTSLSRGGLDRILYLLGLSEEDVQEFLASAVP